MNKSASYDDSYMLQSFDILSMSEVDPEFEVGVNVNRIYIQIAKYSFDPGRADELKILYNAVDRLYDVNMHIDSRYITMCIGDIMACFGDGLKKLPRTTFKKI